MTTTADLLDRIDYLEDVLQEIALYGLSRPRELGEGDDGDGHYKRAAYALVSLAARALKAGP